MDPLEDDDGPEQGEAPDVVAVIQILRVVGRGLEDVQGGEPRGLVVVRYDGRIRRHYYLFVVVVLVVRRRGGCGIEVGGAFLPI